MTELTVGYESHNYGAARNTYAPVQDVSFQKVRRMPLEIVPPLKRFGLNRAFIGLGPHHCDVVHLWNRVSYGPKAWGASFESHYPYIDGQQHPRLMRSMIDRLSRDSCRFLIPISEYARRSLRETVGEDLWGEIEHKVSVIFPNHVPSARSMPYRTMSSTDPLRLLFVGVTFFGKGGEALLRVVEDIGDDLNMYLTVVSPVLGGDYEGIPPESVDPEDIRRRLSNHPRITWLTRLTHDEVLWHMQEHDVGLLPTTADTFGYVVLENMGLGVPTIVSNVQALPEFTGDDTGWVVQLPLDARGLWVGRRPGLAHRAAAYMEAVESIQSQVTAILSSIRDNSEQLERRGRSARERLDRQFDPAGRQQQMLDLYAELVQ